MADNRTVDAALADLRSANGLDAEQRAAPSWTCKLGPLTIRWPNFEWRRHAIARHDLHHVLTGYPCNMRGEFQLAVWEFAAGPYPHAGAQLFCLPLVAAGTLWSPRAMWAAFASGRKATTLYGRELERIRNLPVASLRTECGLERKNRSGIADGLAFFLLVAKAWMLVATPLALATAAILLYG